MSSAPFESLHRPLYAMNTEPKDDQRDDQENLADGYEGDVELTDDDLDDVAGGVGTWNEEPW